MDKAGKRVPGSNAIIYSGQDGSRNLKDKSKRAAWICGRRAFQGGETGSERIKGGSRLHMCEEC